MNKKIDFFLTANENRNNQDTINQLAESGLAHNIFILSPTQIVFNHAETLVCNSPFSTSALKLIAEKSTAEFGILAIQKQPVEMGQFALERMVQVAENTGAALVYADYYETKGAIKTRHQVIDYQMGSLRDDFNFGPVQLFRSDVLKTFDELEFNHAGMYSLRLHASRMGELVRVPEFLFTTTETDMRKTGEKQFDYVSGNAREKQVEMEKVCTSHLKKIGGFIQPPFKEIDFSEADFPVEASVIIPVRNRIRTIKDAVDSVLSQKTAFNFNLIVVDNFSTDGTSEFLSEYSNKGVLLHIVPDRGDLGIGGCWNVGLFSRHCGKFAVQLDSDDLYSSENTLQKIVDKFYKENCAMVIGSYQMTNFDLEEIPPGIIDHKEWTPENGPNNALRINGLGAPRAFYTPVLREIKVPNVSYGEDYAVGLAISREYKIGRIYEPIYLCRRWDDNSDASLDVEKQNAHNLYKDRIRTIELKARIKKMSNS